MNHEKKIFTINYITSIDFNFATSHQIEKNGINFEHGEKKFLSKSLSFYSKYAKIVIYVEIHEMFPVIQLTKSVACILNSNVKNSTLSQIF